VASTAHPIHKSLLQGREEAQTGNHAKEEFLEFVRRHGASQVNPEDLAHQHKHQTGCRFSEAAVVGQTERAPVSEQRLPAPASSDGALQGKTAQDKHQAERQKLS